VWWRVRLGTLIVVADTGLVVVGSGPAGVAAATAYREAGGGGPISVFTADQDLPYERPPLSKAVLAGASDAGEVFLHEQSHYRERDIALHLATTVIELSLEESAIRLADGQVISYGACVLATGSAPIRPAIPGAQLAHVLRTRRDAIALAAAAGAAQTAVVAGSGFIGCEAAASLAARGLAVTMVTEEARPQESRLGAWVGDRISEWLRAAGVELLTNDRLAEIGPNFARTESGSQRSADLVLLATGASPQGTLAAAAGLDMLDGRVRVGADMRTTRDDVFAAGDVAVAFNVSAGREVAVEHWGDALKMGEIAGRVAAGQSTEWTDPPGFWSTIGGHTLKYTAWGDGFDEVRVDPEPVGRFMVRYGHDGELVGILTHDRDEDYERGQTEVQRRAQL
jgi:NADPH-dependent 2,4-dienoyl-CoA reductase/sulfur reductase-like enzyme